jgi:hypothetical protein
MNEEPTTKESAPVSFDEALARLRRLKDLGVTDDVRYAATPSYRSHHRADSFGVVVGNG